MTRRHRKHRAGARGGAGARRCPDAVDGGEDEKIGPVAEVKEARRRRAGGGAAARQADRPLGGQAKATATKSGQQHAPGGP